MGEGRGGGCARPLARLCIQEASGRAATKYNKSKCDKREGLTGVHSP